MTPMNDLAQSTKIALTVAGGSILVGTGELWVWVGDVWSHLPSAESYAQIMGGTLAAVTVVFKVIDYWRSEDYKKRAKQLKEDEEMAAMILRSARQHTSELVEKHKK